MDHPFRSQGDASKHREKSVKKLIIASLAFQLLALASVALLVFTAPEVREPSASPRATHSVQQDVAYARSRLEAAQTSILWNVMALVGISMVAQAAYLVTTRGGR